MDNLKYFKKDFYQRIGGLKMFKNLNVLDLGCGNGEDTFELAKYAKSVTGVDIEKNQAWKKIKKQNLKFKVAPAEKLPFKANTFNGLFLKDVIHHVKDVEKTLKEIKRVTTKDALIILIEGNRYNPLFYIHMTKIHGHEHLTQTDFMALVKKYFPNAEFSHFEAHYIPFFSLSVTKLYKSLEKIVSAVPFFKSLLSYNVALIRSLK